MKSNKYNQLKWTQVEIENLKKDYFNLSKEQLESKYNRNFDSIRVKCNAIGLKKGKPKNNKKYKLPLPKIEIGEIYIQGKTTRELAILCNCSTTNINRILKSLDVKRRNSSEAAKMSMTEDVKNKIRKKRVLQIFPTISTIEKIIEKQLKINNIIFEAQWNLGNKFQCDFYIPELNLIIEADGDYWHNREDMKKRDKAKNAYAKKCGYKILRIWERNIKKKDFNLMGLLSAYNILRKVIPNALSNGIARCGLHPVIINVNGCE